MFGCLLILRPAVLSCGLWGQVRIDCGTEFYLMSFIQEMLAEHRHNLQRLPYLLTPSTRVSVSSNPGVLQLMHTFNESMQTDTILKTYTEPCDRENVGWGECMSQLPVEDSFGTAGGTGRTWHGGQLIQVLCVKPDLPGGWDWPHQCRSSLECTQDPRYDSFSYWL